MLVRELIERLGGATAVATACNLPPVTVRMWAVRDRVAAEYHIAVWRLAEAAGVAWRPPGAEGLRLSEDAA
jgi:hypothetical protein